ncbi:hypothetical protein GCM10022395_19710 [Snuella lapsa]|uniref:Uncharacterized protein n=1 Tax=Snuella lapsa TaxID=870481 RepID=A0ABP6XQC5_9FLAO
MQKIIILYAAFQSLEVRGFNNGMGVLGDKMYELRAICFGVGAIKDNCSKKDQTKESHEMV